MPLTPAGAKWCVAGEGSLLGEALARHLEASGHPRVLAGAEAPNWRDPGAVAAALGEARPDILVVAEGLSGGIAFNVAHPVDLALDNLQVATSILPAAHAAGVGRLVYLASSCTYPREAPQPLVEASLGQGPLEPTNHAYASAKLAGMALVQAYRAQHGRAWVAAIPANAFGVKDHFETEAGHVVPALLHRFHEAKLQGAPSLSVWGSGSPRRELIFADDLAEAIVAVALGHEGPGPINLAGGEAPTVLELAHLIAQVVGYQGAITTDPSKPDGMPFKALDPSGMRALGWAPKTPLAEGLRRSYQAYLAQRDPQELAHA